MTLGGLANRAASRLGNPPGPRVSAAERAADPLVAALREGDDVTVQVTRQYGAPVYYSGRVFSKSADYVGIYSSRGGQYALHRHSWGTWTLSADARRIGTVSGVVNRSSDDILPSESRRWGPGDTGAFDGAPAGWRVVSVGFAVDIYKGSTYVARAQLGGMMHGQRLIDYFPRGSYKLFKRDGDVNLPRSIFPEIKRLLGYDAA